MGDRKNLFPSCSKKYSGWWNSFWKLKLPNKIKVFVWRACKNILPTFGNLHKRKIADAPCCLKCNTEVETCCHALIDCPIADEIWKLKFIDGLRKVSKAGDFYDFIQDIGKLFNDDELCLVFVILWFI